MLVVGELALALALLVGAGLLIRSFDRLVQVSPGFASDHLLTFIVSVPAAKYPKDEDVTRFYDEALSRMAAVGGVQAIGATDTLPFSGDWSTTSFAVDGYQPPKGQPSPWGDVRGISAGYHSAMGIRLLRGRFISDTDRPDSRQVTVVDDETVRRYWPNSDPIGKRITFDDPTKPPVKWIEVVGVVAHTAHEGLDAERRTQMYFSRAQFPSRNMYIAARTTRDPMSLTPDLRRALASVDRDVPLYQVQDDGGADGDGCGPTTARHGAAGRVRRHGAASGCVGHFRRHLVRRHPADAGAGSAGWRSVRTAGVFCR